MKILIHSKTADSIGLAHRFQAEGHQVFVFMKDSYTKRTKEGEGMLEIVPSLTSGMNKKPDFVLFDMVGDGDLADRLKKSGVPVLGASSFADNLELKREYGMEIMKKYGIRIPETLYFNSVEEAVKHIKEDPKPHVVKFDGNKSAASSYVSKNQQDMIEYLSYIKEAGMIKPGTKFILQEVVKGAEISTEVWFSRGYPVLPFNGTLETKNFIPGDLGPKTGCETSAVFKYDAPMPMMVNKTIRKLFPIMKEMGYTGPLDINCIVSEVDHEPYGLEFTARLGYSAIYALSAMIEGGIGNFFYGIASGKIPRIKVQSLWGTSLRLSIPPYPFEDPEHPDIEHQVYEESKGQWIDVPQSPNIWLLDARKGPKNKLLTAGVNGIICECTGQGNTLFESWSISQNLFKKVVVPNKQGRYTDGAERAFRDTARLKNWGYDIPSAQGQASHLPLVRSSH